MNSFHVVPRLRSGAGEVVPAESVLKKASTSGTTRRNRIRTSQSPQGEARAYPGRPRIAAEFEALVVRFAGETRGWGYDRIVGALASLGHSVSSDGRQHPAPAQAEKITAACGLVFTRACLKKGSSWRPTCRYAETRKGPCELNRSERQQARSAPRLEASKVARLQKTSYLEADAAAAALDTQSSDRYPQTPESERQAA